jgi:CheY-like chemotaxis protein
MRTELISFLGLRDGLRQVTSDPFGLAFVDGNMPEIHGLKLIRRIRGEQNLLSMPIGVLTTEAAKGDGEGAITLDGRGDLTKLIQTNQVLAASKSLFKLYA